MKLGEKFVECRKIQGKKNENCDIWMLKNHRFQRI